MPLFILDPMGNPWDSWLKKELEPCGSAPMKFLILLGLKLEWEETKLIDGYRKD